MWFVRQSGYLAQSPVAQNTKGVREEISDSDRFSRHDPNGRKLLRSKSVGDCVWGEMDGDGTNGSNKAAACRELIVYACPTRELAASLEDYFAAAMERCGSNTAHEYMPHCTLTGFFHDARSSVSYYVAALEQALAWGKQQPEPAIAISGVQLEPEFHYLAVRSPWLESVTAKFAELADSSTRIDALRLKSNLHVSLAYGFEPEWGEALKEIAGELDWQVAVGWEVRFYERHLHLAGSSAASRQKDLERRWTCHGCWEV